MDAALLGAREGIWQPCAPSCSGRNGSAALPCWDIRRRQWVGASQPAALRCPSQPPPPQVTCYCLPSFRPALCRHRHSQWPDGQYGRRGIMTCVLLPVKAVLD